MQRNLPTPPPPANSSHGGPRGLTFTSRSTLREGRFGRMFRSLPPASWDDVDLELLAGKMSAPPDAGADADQEDPEENFGIPAGYTYFGQFVDHDLTFDPASSLQQLNDPGRARRFSHPALRSRLGVWARAARPAVSVSGGRPPSAVGPPAHAG